MSTLVLAGIMAVLTVWMVVAACTVKQSIKKAIREEESMDLRAAAKRIEEVAGLRAGTASQVLNQLADDLEQGVVDEAYLEKAGLAGVCTVEPSPTPDHPNAQIIRAGPGFDGPPVVEADDGTRSLDASGFEKWLERKL